MNEKILIVEDEERISLVLVDYLAESGFEPHCLQDGVEVVPWVKKNSPDLILLDIMLPGCNGFDICTAVRSFSTVPIIMVTACDEEKDRLLGLGLGADDYVCKPFSPSEVVARVKASLRRAKGQFGSLTSMPVLVLNEDLFMATLCGHKMELTPVEFKLLQTLSAKPGRVYSRTQLMELIFVQQHAACDRSIDSHIKNLRKKMMTVVPGQPFIHSVYGIGYKFEPAS